MEKTFPVILLFLSKPLVIVYPNDIKKREWQVTSSLGTGLKSIRGQISTLGLYKTHHTQKNNQSSFRSAQKTEVFCTLVEISIITLNIDQLQPITQFFGGEVATICFQISEQYSIQFASYLSLIDPR